MQRVRMSLGYFAENGWEPTVMCVEDRLADGFRDDLLTETVPQNIKVVRVGAYHENITRKVGLGSISLRSLPHFKKAGSRLLKSGGYDLVFISTSMHHLMALGRYWKKKFGVPFIVDMQDPWRNDIHLSKAIYQQSFKYRLAYKINKQMEAYTMPYADGIMAVSKTYIDTLKERYPSIKNIPARTITFGASIKDFELVKKKSLPAGIPHTNGGRLNVLYMGAVTEFFIPVIRLFFESLKEHREDLSQYHFYFIGTAYTPGSNITMVATLAQELGISQYVTEVPGRLPYFNALATLQAADILFIPGSVDSGYNASKVYNNILSGTPIFSIFHRQSSVIKAIEQSGTGAVYAFDNLENTPVIKTEIFNKWQSFLQNRGNYKPGNTATMDFTADKKTKEICNFFDEVLQSVR